MRYFLRISDVVNDPLFRAGRSKWMYGFRCTTFGFRSNVWLPREWGIRLRPVNPTTYDLLTPRSMT